MRKVRQFLEGKKSYLSALGLVISAGLYGLGYIDEGTATILYGLFGGTGVASLKAAK